MRTNRNIGVAAMTFALSLGALGATASPALAGGRGVGPSDEKVSGKARACMVHSLNYGKSLGNVCPATPPPPPDGSLPPVPPDEEL